MKYIAIDSKGRAFYFYNRQLQHVVHVDTVVCLSNIAKRAGGHDIKVISFATGKAKDTIIKAAQESTHFVYFPSSKEIEKFKLFKALKKEMSRWYSALQLRMMDITCGNCGKPCESGLCVECSTPSSDVFSQEENN